MFIWKKICLAVFILSMMAFSAYAEKALVVVDKTPIYEDAELQNKIDVLGFATVVEQKNESNGVIYVNDGKRIGYIEQANVVLIQTLSEKVRVSRNTKIYKTASEKATTQSIKAGQELDCLAVNGKWAMIYWKDTIAYIKTADTEKIQSGIRYEEYTAYTNCKAKAYKNANTKSTVLGTLSKGIKIIVIAESEKWVYVEKGDKKFYLLKSEITTNKPVTTEAPPTEVIKRTFDAYVNVGSMPVFARNDDASKVLGKLGYGRAVTVYAYTKDWAYIGVGENRGFAKVSQLSEKPVATATPIPVDEVITEQYAAMVTVSSAKVYEKPNTSARKIVSLSKNMKVTVYAQNSEWAYIGIESNRGYIKLTNLMRIAETTAVPVVIDEYEAEIITDQAIVYAKASKGARSLGKLGLGSCVTVTAYTDTWAKVTKNGKSGFMHMSDLRQMGEFIESTLTAKVTVARLTGYDKPDTSSKSIVQLSKGEIVEVVSFNSSWAKIKNKSGVAYVRIEGLEKYTVTIDDILENEQYSVEQKIYLYLTKEMKLNSAAACGILANVEKECSFHVTSASNDGGYGIVQWTGGRNTRLRNWCNSNGYDYSTLSGQLRYLDYELKTYQTKTLKYLQNVENSAQGAYDAAHYFCYYFEVPSSKATRSVTRGNLARDKYWPKYNK